ncbi:LamG-like jellyroll fold domain-containing protein [Coraliomargarita algicola]|uniref:LamG-like jellyroll fold domain-containing protein n=1 Tax=Coraliomargarita algicola TaxID=3092156 RepID=A0ABZ0RI27_9BACT|nr:LamG-like jellyroll fold domain-containing protein [Coraliomargarita sp. J2-16]WPJ95846.1 LamG-like jellyroll fold domain-containing protein [Coraliomargarita sp. J2-16]
MYTPLLEKCIKVSLLWILVSASSLHAVNYNLKKVSNVGGGLPYILHLPEIYDDPSEAAREFPTIIYLHGYGERGESDFYGNTNYLYKVENGGSTPPYYTARSNYLNFEVNGQTEHFILIAPQTQAAWTSENVIALLDEVSAQYRVDSSRVYLTGFSFGGTGTWEVLLGDANVPNRFAAAAVVAGRRKGSTSSMVKIAEDNVAIWSMSGLNDNTEHTPEVVLRANSAISVHYPDAEHIVTMYPGYGHSCSRQYSLGHTYHNPNLYEWFLSKTLQTPGLPARVNLSSRSEAIATAGDEDPEHGAARGKTGSGSQSYWSSSTTDYSKKWIQLDLGASFSVDKIFLRTLSLYDALAGYNIQASNNGVDWDTIIVVDDNYQSTRVHNFEAVDVRYLRLNVIDANWTSGALKDTAYLFEFLAFEALEPLDPPTAPAAVSATSVTSGGVTLDWNAGTGTVQNYRIYWSATNTQPFSHQASVAGDITNYTATGLAPETEYFFWVSAHNSGGESGTASTSATTDVLLPPNAPSTLNISGPTATSLTLSWQDNADNESAYNIYWNTTNSQPASPNTTVAANATNTLVEGLSPSTLYYFWVAAFNAEGTSSAATTNGSTTDFEGSLAYGLLSRWKFDALSGDTAFDTQGFNDGTLTGNTARTSESIAGQALTFDGTNDWVEAPHQSEYSSNALSISMWVRPSVADSEPRGLISKRQGLTAGQRCFAIFSHTNSNINIDLGNQRVTTNYSLNEVNTWKHLTMTFDGAEVSDNVKLYIDGDEVASNTITVTAIPVLDCPITIGILNTDYGFGFAGDMDEVRVYDRALTAAEVQALDKTEPYTGSSTPASYSEWKAAMLSELPVADQEPSADPDHDGIANIFEYAQGSLPTDSSSGSRPHGEITSESNFHFLTFSYRRIQGGTGSAESGYEAGNLRYTVQISPDLSPDSWTTGTDYLESVPPAIDHSDDSETVTVRVKDSVENNSKKFIRLQVEELN